MVDLTYGITKLILSKNIKTLREGGYEKADAVDMAVKFQQAQIDIRKGTVKR